eukprot:TRINITY_DN39064_c0_g1_i1.p1 TRINITY_DN39064_c0_g1~~TRINITY_DN39064_c0_g1_i1.p1  ORF type:complete len:214 (-),score=3.88 TRINITY_DN39064_c0_g1_i1:246-887(-)
MDDTMKAHLFKTRMCRNMQTDGVCRFAARCIYAHSAQELRPRPHIMSYATARQSFPNGSVQTQAGGTYFASGEAHIVGDTRAVDHMPYEGVVDAPASKHTANGLLQYRGDFQTSNSNISAVNSFGARCAHERDSVPGVPFPPYLSNNGVSVQKGFSAADYAGAAHSQIGHGKPFIPQGQDHEKGAVENIPLPRWVRCSVEARKPRNDIHWNDH